MARRTSRGPLAVLSEQSSRTSGRDAQSMNIAAGRAVAEAIRTTLGPRGMDKMLVDSGGNVVVTNDGVTLLEEMEIEHPAADLVVEVAQTQEADVGDGTTSAVVLAGELLAGAEELVEDGVHPTTVVSGYREARDRTRTALQDMAVDVEPDDTETLEQIAATAMTGKGAERARDLLADLVVRAVAASTDQNGNVDRDGIHVRTFYGAALSDSRFLEGVTLGKEPPHPDMPRSLTDAGIAIYDGALEVSELETDLDVTVTDPDSADGFLERERAELDEAVDHLVDVGADVVVADGAIDDRAQQRLADAGVLGLRRIQEDDIERIQQATGASIVGDPTAVTEDDLGYAGEIDEIMVRELAHHGSAQPEKVLHFQDTGASAGGTIWLRGATEHVVEEVERAVEDALDVVATVVEHGSILPGGGAPEMELALQLRETAESVEGREQLAVEAFAEALEAGPRVLAENGGHDVIDALVELTARHDAGERTAGLDADTGEPIDAMEAGIVEPFQVKATAIESAVDAATMLLRIDDVVAAGDLSTGGDDEEEAGGAGGMGGMGGMGGAM